MKMLLSKFRNKYQGIPAAILGGGPSLPEDLKRVPDNAILIAVNYHAFYQLKIVKIQCRTLSVCAL